MNLPDLIAVLEPIVNSRVYPLVIPIGVISESNRDAVIRVALVSATPDNTVDGVVDDADESRYQIDIFSPTYSDALTKKILVRNALTAFTTPPTTIELETTFYDDADKLYRQTIDVVFHDSSI